MQVSMPENAASYVLGWFGAVVRCPLSSLSAMCHQLDCLEQHGRGRTLQQVEDLEELCSSLQVGAGLGWVFCCAVLSYWQCASGCTPLLTGCVHAGPNAFTCSLQAAPMWAAVTFSNDQLTSSSRSPPLADSIAPPPPG